MGAWGYKNFENDTALDFLEDISETKNKRMIYKIFDETMDESGFLEATTCSEALAAAEMICLITEGDLEVLPTSVIDWYKNGVGLFKKKVNFSSAELKKAACVVEKIISDSELKDLWSESDDFSEWKQVNEELVNRLLSHI